MNYVVVKLNFEGVHKYPEAPKGVSYLSYSHRHLFAITAKVQVFHTDRELEIIKLKHSIEEEFRARYSTTALDGIMDFGRKSCEELAIEVQEFIQERYATPTNTGFTRSVGVQVLEDGENGAEVTAQFGLTSKASTETAASSIPPVLGNTVGIDLTKQNVVPSYNDQVQKGFEYLQKMANDVAALDDLFGLDKDLAATTTHLLFESNAMVGEAGEAANFVKKLVRDGYSDNLKQELGKELCDVIIYLIKLAMITKIDLSAIWDAKHKELLERYRAGKQHLSYDRKDFHNKN